MGMFDTFYGKIKCPLCGELHEFEEQTKRYDCFMESFKLGDYIDKANETYVYHFDVACLKYKKLFNGNIVIVNGQIVRFVNDLELQELSIDSLENIEEGLGWRLEYEERCKVGIGYTNDTGAFGLLKREYEKLNWNDHPKNSGDKLFALGNEWEILESYSEIFTENEENKLFGFHKMVYEQSYVYKIKGELGIRIARVSENRYISLYYDNGFKEKFDFENPYDFHIQHGCVLQEINN